MNGRRLFTCEGARPGVAVGGCIEGGDHGTIYARGTRLWIGYREQRVLEKYAATKFLLGQESKARELLEAIERRAKAAGEFGEASLGA